MKINKPMQSFVDRLIIKIKEKRSHIVVGLDPVYENLPDVVKQGKPFDLNGIGKAIEEFNIKLIDAIADLVPAIKPQIAFYERYGIEGIKAFVKTVNYGKEKGLIVVEDAKRNDIGSTAAAYSDGHIGKIQVKDHSISVFNVDAITVNAYLGSDGIIPFLENVKKFGKGIFILVKTSNPSSVDLQDVGIIYRGKKQKLFEHVARLVNEWGENHIGKSGYSSVGAVVGATFPEDAKILRELMPKAYFLVPGYGAQGGKASDVVQCFNRDGLGALVAASRSINYAYKKSDKYTNKEYAEAARDAVLRMNSEINFELDIRKMLCWSN